LVKGARARPNEDEKKGKIPKGTHAGRAGEAKQVLLFETESVKRGGPALEGKGTTGPLEGGGAEEKGGRRGGEKKRKNGHVYYYEGSEKSQGTTVNNEREILGRGPTQNETLKGKHGTQKMGNKYPWVSWETSKKTEKRKRGPAAAGCPRGKGLPFTTKPRQSQHASNQATGNKSRNTNHKRNLGEKKGKGPKNPSRKNTKIGT